MLLPEQHQKAGSIPPGRCCSDMRSQLQAPEQHTAMQHMTLVAQAQRQRRPNKPGCAFIMTLFFVGDTTANGLHWLQQMPPADTALLSCVQQSRTRLAICCRSQNSTWHCHHCHAAQQLAEQHNLHQRHSTCIFPDTVRGTNPISTELRRVPSPACKQARQHHMHQHQADTLVLHPSSGTPTGQTGSWPSCPHTSSPTVAHRAMGCPMWEAPQPMK